ncbi:MAG TPA: MBL fold metallo-hydrolase [Anaerolineae bacterium]
MILERLVVGALQVNCYLLGSERTRRAIVIDAGDNVPAILAALQRHDLTLSYILATHGHFDHVLAARGLQEATGAAFYIHPADRPQLENMRQVSRAWLGTDAGEPPIVNGDLQPGGSVQLDDITLEVRATPGHSSGGVSFVDRPGKRVFTGDALFAGSIGRTDLPGGDARTLLDGIRSQIISLPEDFAVLPGHGPATTVGQEARSNPFLDPAAFDSWL